MKHIIGMEFGRITIKELAEEITVSIYKTYHLSYFVINHIWKCKCACGRNFNVPGAAFYSKVQMKYSKGIKDCGCKTLANVIAKKTGMNSEDVPFEIINCMQNIKMLDGVKDRLLWTIKQAS